MPNESLYREFFERINDRTPYEHQLRVAQALYEGHNVFLRAPTGSGKTLAVLTPFLHNRQALGVARLIYALPLRALVQSVYNVASGLAGKLGYPDDFVTVQTGETPQDPFFDRGTVIVTTYDQLLSGLLNRPYGQSARMRNVNAASVVSALVVFDEFHLMETSEAFLTAVALIQMFKGLCLSVWMTATATAPLERMLNDALHCVSIPRSRAEFREMMCSLPVVTAVRRELQCHRAPMDAGEIARLHRGRAGDREKRSLVIMNTVGRAQEMYRALIGEGLNPVLLHSRFFRDHRRVKQETIQEVFGDASGRSGILVATQVVEAGLDITCDHLHTEICPANSLVQRAGRCARFRGESGVVHVYPIQEGAGGPAPYGEDEIRATWAALAEVGGVLDPETAAFLVEKVHTDRDREVTRGGWLDRFKQCRRLIYVNLTGTTQERVSHLIRKTDDSRVIIASTPPTDPTRREGLSVPRGALRKLLESVGGLDGVAWLWDFAVGDGEWRPVGSPAEVMDSYLLCVSPGIASYTFEFGLELGKAGEAESPQEVPPPRPGYGALKRETWVEHAAAIARTAEKRLARDLVGHSPAAVIQRGFPVGYDVLSEAVTACAVLHDVGKMQQSWQGWASRYQQAKEPGYHHSDPLAHTDFDPELEADRLLDRSLGTRRPPHAAASAFYAGFLLWLLLPLAGATEHGSLVYSSCVAAILSHHGSWLGHDGEVRYDRLCMGWESAVRPFLPAETHAWLTGLVREAEREKLKREKVEGAVKEALSFDRFKVSWPLTAYLCRTLRLSDQRATAEGGAND